MSLGAYLWLFFIVAWPYQAISNKQLLPDPAWLPFESFLWLDPLVGVSAAIAARAWNAALAGSLAILLICLFFPRGFCAWLCPQGTLIDMFDWLLGRRVSRLRLPRLKGWTNLRYYLLAAVLVCALCGVMLAGFVAALPMLTRGLMFSAGQLQLGLLRNWGQVKFGSAADYLSLASFLLVFLLSLLGLRFWCRCVCPSGAIFSALSGLRLFERKLAASCVDCGRCIERCPFDAIRADVTTRSADCAFCQTCGGVCPTNAISFESRWKGPAQPAASAAPEAGALSRRHFILSTVAGGAAGAATRAVLPPPKLLRPPGAVDERRFLQLCVRCGECYKVCPGPVLHPAGLGDGWEALWTPVAVPTLAGCHQDCNYCTQVCPTQAIQPLTLEQKRKTVMGVAVLNTRRCLPHAGERDCRLCYDECTAAGYDAIELRQIQLPIGEVPEGAVSAEELEEMSRIQAPFVIADKCVGCGLCEYRCHVAVARQQKLLPASAIVVEPAERT